MAREQRKVRNPWDRFVIWMRANQRVIWVFLLILVAFSFGFVGPVQDFFTGRSAGGPSDVVYGRTVTQTELTRLNDQLGRVLSIAQQARMADFRPLPGALGTAYMSFGQMSPFEFCVFREKARRLGMRVSDRELVDVIAELWRRNVAAAAANEEIEEKARQLKPGDQEGTYRLRMEFYTTLQKHIEELRAKPVDSASWVEMVQGGKTGAVVTEFESLLGDLILVSKLEEFIRESVVVSPKEVFDEFLKQMERRKLSWAEAKVPEALRERVAKTVTPAAVRTYYERNRTAFERPATVQSSWLLLPRDHFKEVARGKVTEEDLRLAYQENRNQYRRAVVSSEEGAFALRTAEEQAALDAKLYLPLEEVKDKVRDSVIENRTLDEMRTFGDQVKGRLFPAPALAGTPAKPAATFGELAKEFPYLSTGSTAYVTADEAKAAFGGAYGYQVTSWFSSLERGRGKADLKAPERAVPCEGGMAFYGKVASRSPMLPPLAEIEPKVRDAVVTRDSLDLLAKALEDVSTKINEGKLDLAAALAAPLQVPVGGEQVEVRLGALQSALDFVDSKGDLKVAKTPPAGETKVEAEDPDSKDEDESAHEETHPAGSALRTAGFSVPENGKTAVASDSKSSSAFLVKLDDRVPPNPGSFEEEKRGIESRLLSDRQRTHYVNWRKKILEEARGGRPLVESPEDGAEDVPAS